VSSGYWYLRIFKIMVIAEARKATGILWAQSVGTEDIQEEEKSMNSSIWRLSKCKAASKGKGICFAITQCHRLGNL
jgi:hypothetical protein